MFQISVTPVPGLENGPFNNKKMEPVDARNIFGTIVYSILIFNDF
jgi:hypothetical protein